MILDWSRWLASVPGYNLNAVASATLMDMTVTPPSIANESEICIVTGMEPDVRINPLSDPIATPQIAIDPSRNAHGDVATAILPPVATQTLFKVGDKTAIGKQYRFNISVTARDCDGRRITQTDCVMVVIAQC